MKNDIAALKRALLLLTLGVACLASLGCDAPEETIEAAPLRRSTEKPCNRFHLQPGQLKQTCWRARRLVSDFPIPAQDASYEVEGALLVDAELLPAGGRAVPAPEAAATFGVPALSDWQVDEAFSQSFPGPDFEPGELIFSPSSGWVYFHLTLNP